MVDAASTFRAKSPFGQRAAAIGDVHDAGFGMVQVADFGAVQAFERFCTECAFSPAQDPAWIRGFASTSGREIILATVSRAGRPLIGVALEIAQVGPFRVARFPGGTHANGNFPAVSEPLSSAGCATAAETLVKAISLARPDIDALVLERQLREHDGRANPLVTTKSTPSPNIALAVDLAGGFEQLLERASGKRKRKKHRSQMRKFEAAGGYRRIEAATHGQVDRLLDAFFVMKAQRFAKMGVPDVFAPPAVRESLRSIFRQSLTASPAPFQLHGLEVGGELRAVTGSSISGDRIICEFGAIREDELAPVSPGDFLFYENIREACARGFAVYDFSVGDEPYKRLWCDIETTQFDTHVALTAKGRLLAGAARGAARVKRIVKTDPRLAALLKRVRRSTAVGAKPEAASEED